MTFDLISFLIGVKVGAFAMLALLTAVKWGRQ